jgi:hypothetical protein
VTDPSLLLHVQQFRSYRECCASCPRLPHDVDEGTTTHHASMCPLLSLSLHASLFSPCFGERSKTKRNETPMTPDHVTGRAFPCSRTFLSPCHLKQRSLHRYACAAPAPLLQASGTLVRTRQTLCHSLVFLLSPAMLYGFCAAPCTAHLANRDRPASRASVG